MGRRVRTGSLVSSLVQTGLVPEQLGLFCSHQPLFPLYPLFRYVFRTKIRDGLKRLQNIVPAGTTNMQEGLKKVQDNYENLFCLVKFLRVLLVHPPTFFQFVAGK